MAKKRATRKPSGANDNINDFLERREVRKYGPRIVGNEAQYSQGEMSKALSAKMSADRFLAGRTVESGTRSILEGLRGWIRGGGGSRLTGR